MKDKIKNATLSFVSRCKTICNRSENRKLHKVLSDLQADKSIRVCSFDKGNGIVILNATDYTAKLDQIIGDTDKFRMVDQVASVQHPVIKQEKSIQNSVRTHIKPLIDDENQDQPWKISSADYLSKLYPTGSQPGKLYGLCKVHKEGDPLRPVVSMVGTAGYGLAQYLDRIIKPHIPSAYMLSSTGHFIEKVKSFIFGAGDVIVSFDVVSLFTNIPLTETINLIADYVYQVPANAPPFSKLVFKNMLKLATGGYFLHNGKLYVQVDGVSMGSPLGPTLANFFLGHLEKERIFNEPKEELYPRLYLRYVDDVFAVFSAGMDPMLFLTFLNNLHSSLKFTVEVGLDRMPFLDTEVSIKDGNFETWVYRKKTNTHVMLNAFSQCPGEWKRGLVYGALHRAWTICSSSELFQQEVEKLKDLFIKNGYSDTFFNKLLVVFTRKKESDAQQNNEQLLEEEEQKRYVLSIPFVGKPSLVFKRKMTEIFKETLNVDLRCVFSSFKVKNYFSLKCETPTYLNSNVTYKFTCQHDAARFYIGETTRHIVVRAGEHLTLFSPSQYPTAVGQHIKDCEHCMCALECGELSWKNFEIMSRCKSKIEVRVKEAFLIRKLKPELNMQLHEAGSSVTLKVFG